MASNPHDGFVKSTFSHAEFAADEFRTALPPALVAHLDFRTLKRCPGSFVDEAFKERVTDLLYSVELAGQDAFIYLLFEHQSTVDRLLILRLWRYMGDIWQDYCKEHPEARRLPVIIPLVLHHSRAGWTGPKTMRELFDMAPELRQELDAYLPELTFVLDDLSTQDDDELRRRATGALVKLTLWSLKNARDADDFLDRMLGWGEIFGEVALVNGMGALDLIMRYILDVREVEPVPFAAFLANHIGRQAHEAYMTAAQILEQQGEQRGREEALRSTLTKQLPQRFGALPDKALERIAHASHDELMQWVERILVAPTLDHVFDGPSAH